MVAPSIRALLCVLVGSLAGSTLGALLVPNPTSAVAFGLSVGCTAVIAGYLHRSDWLRE